MSCVAESSVTEVVWYLNGKKLTQSSHFEFHSTADGTCYLYISDLSNSDQGEYTCEVITEEGVSKTSFSFVGQVFQSIYAKVTTYVEQQMSISGSMKTQELQKTSQREETSMAAQMKKEQMIEIHGESQMVMMEQSTLEHESFSSQAIQMASSMHETSFSSSSIAEVKFETMSMSSMSSLTSETYAMSSSSLTEMSSHVEGSSMRVISHSSQGSAPRIEALPEDISIEAGKVLTVACAFSGDPVPRIEWSRSGRTLPGEQESGRFHIETLDDLTTLIITGVRGEDAGAYTLKLSNDLGSDTATVNISIRSM